jgi:hypothetical protein
LVVGESDAKADKPKSNPITPGDLGATAAHAAGVSSEIAANMGITLPGRVLQELF